MAAMGALLVPENAENGENGTPLAEGPSGELCLCGPQLTPGYWNNPEKNAECFFEVEGTRFYRTGDLAERDADGDLHFCGRVDHHRDQDVDVARPPEGHELAEEVLVL